MALITGYISHWFRLREIKIQSADERERLEALWAEEERRRKADRRRELCERRLEIVRAAVNALVETVDRTESSTRVGTDLNPGARLELGTEAYLMAGKANMLAALDDQQLEERLGRLIQVCNRWTDLLDFNTGEAKERKEDEFEESQEGVRRMGSEVVRRIREILEEV